MNRKWGILNLGVHRLISNGPLAARRGLGMGGVLSEGTIELKPSRIDLLNSRGLPCYNLFPPVLILGALQ